MVTPKDSFSEEELLRRLQNSDEKAWAELVTGEYGTRLFNYLRHKLPTQQDVEEVMQDTFSAAVRAIPNFDGRVKLLTFLFSLAQHKLADFWRRQPETDELPETIIDPGANQDGIEFIEILQRLKDEHRQVLLMRYHIGLGVDEIASVLGKTYRGAESLLSRARAELRLAMSLDP